MLLHILTLVTVTLLFLISILHFYWAFGGTWGIKAAIPERLEETYFDQKNQLLIKIATLTVAIGLLIFIYIILSSTYLTSNQIIPTTWFAKLTTAIGILFSIRAIGDFNMFGIFKKRSDSLFAKRDTQIFVPLCIYLGLSCLYIGQYS